MHMNQLTTQQVTPARRSGGDEQLFRQLFEAHRQAVYSQVFGMTRSRWHAEEIVQEVFMKVWIHWAKLSGVRDMNSWLYVVTKRVVFDYVVRLSKERKFLSLYKRYETFSFTDDALLPARCRRLLTEAEQKLSPRQKEVYYLKQVKGLHQREIARILNIAELTAVHHIKSSVSAVRKYVLMNLEMEYRKRA